MKPISLLVVLALVFGALASWIDLHATEPQPAALIILVSAFSLGVYQPKWAWLAALILGSSIFLGSFLAQILRFPAASLPEPTIFAGLAALIPAFIGAYAGVLLRWIFRSVQVQP